MKFLVFLSIFVVFAAVMVTCSAEGVQGPPVAVLSRIASPSQAVFMCSTDADCNIGCICEAEACTC